MSQVDQVPDVDVGTEVGLRAPWLLLGVSRSGQIIDAKCWCCQWS
ncbi:hypothetical protein [Actinomadura sp. KC216]|nr:hypothetical protein [Actinomadura sp. KC216]